MTSPAELPARLEAILSPERILSAEQALRLYAIDGMLPAVAVLPASAAEAAEVVRFASIEGLSVIASGSRTKLDIGATPSRYDIAINTSSLSGIVHYDPGDLTLSVEAGTPLRQLEEELAEAQQFLPIAVPCFETTTVGGAIASGIDSVLRLSYGSPRDFLLGAEFIDGTGQLCKSGGQVVKNVTGYDLHKLLLGSLGTLGVITKLNFRTFPLPAASGGSLTCFTSAPAAFDYLRAIETRGYPLSNIELLSPELAAIIRGILQHAGGNVPLSLAGDMWSIYVSCEGSEPVVARVSRELFELAPRHNAETHEPLGQDFDEHLGGMLREAFEWLRFSSPAVVIARVQLPRFAAEALDVFARAADAHGIELVFLLRAAGIAYVTLQAGTADEVAHENLSRATRELFALVDARRGACQLLHAPDELKPRLPVWGGAADASLLRRVKQSFDPKNVFAPGRFAGGI